jgi:DNA-binding XRE family transcriptional regulator
MARPTAYKQEYDETAEKLSKLGMTDKEMASFFSVKEQTINNWKKSHPSFFESIKRGKDLADANVVESLYRRALGYNHPEDDIRTLTVGGGMSQIVITPTVKHYPPDTTACLAWLHNRQREKWQRNPDPSGGSADIPPTKVIFEVQDARTRDTDGS